MRESMAGSASVLLLAFGSLLGCSDDALGLPRASAALDAGLPDGSGGAGGTGGADLASVHGTVSVQPDIYPPLPGDLVGTLYVGVLVDVSTPASLASSAADLGAGSVSYAAGDLPPGRYLVSALFDDNADFSPDAPIDAGDLWNPIAAEIELGAGQDLELDLLLDTPVPPDTPYCGSEPLDATERQCVFDFITTLAGRYYPYFATKGIDWSATETSYAAQLATVGDDRAFRLLMTQLVAELRDGHSHVATKDLAIDLGIGAVVTGVELARLGDEVYVERVDDGSEAQAAGLAVGHHVLSIDGVALPELEQSFGKYVAHSTDPAYDNVLVQLWLAGAVGSDASVLVEGTASPLVVPRSIPEGSGATLYSARLPGSSGAEYGYIRIPSFGGAAELVGAFDAALDQVIDTPGLILDVRENGGGLDETGLAMAGRFTEVSMEVERYYFRGSADYLTGRVWPRKTAYLGPVVVLIDEQSYSEGHVFATVLRRMGRATLLGRATGGGNGTAEAWTLTPALHVAISTKMVTMADGQLEVELGTAPDVEIARTVADIQAGQYSKPGDPAFDVVLREAIAQLGD